MQSSLHKHAGAAERDRLVDLFANGLDWLHIGIWRAGPAIERAERADDVADIRVVDIPIDDAGDHVAGMATLTNLVGRIANRRHVVRFEQSCAVADAQALAVEHAIQNPSDLGVRHRIKSSDLRNNTQSAASNSP